MSAAFAEIKESRCYSFGLDTNEPGLYLFVLISALAYRALRNSSTVNLDSLIRLRRVPDFSSRCKGMLRDLRPSAFMRT